MSRNDQRPRIRDLSLSPGTRQTGSSNALTDVPGVRVGHVSLRRRPDSDVVINTGVSVIDPADRDVFSSPVRGATHVINGHRKTLGLHQIEEVGEIETPIALTNTLNVWRVADALVTETPT
jgi:D-aminopeptidase